MYDFDVVSGPSSEPPKAESLESPARAPGLKPTDLAAGPASETSRDGAPARSGGVPEK